MHWEALLKEVLTKQKQHALSYPSSKIEKESGKESKKFYLGAPHQDIYFTGREAEVMVQLLQGKTLNEAAKYLKLSPRTIEFYVKNMKTKLACRTKSELIGKVFASDFIKKVNFIEKIFAEKE